MVKLVGGVERSTVFGVMLLTPGTTRVSVMVSGTLPISVYVTVPVCTYTCACTLPAESPGRFGAMAVAAVGNSTVSVVLPVMAVARAWASTVLPRVKFTTGRPKPWFAKPLPVMVKLVGGVERSTVFGVMLLTPGTTRVSVMVSGTLPISVYVTVPVCTYTCACTLPADRPGRFGARAVAAVGNSTVSVVLPVMAVARAWASTVLPRVKFTTGRPKPWFAKPLPVMVKLVGGVARSIVAGVMVLTPGAGVESTTVSGTPPIRL